MILRIKKEQLDLIMATFESIKRIATERQDGYFSSVEDRIRFKGIEEHINSTYKALGVKQ